MPETNLIDGSGSPSSTGRDSAVDRRHIFISHSHEDGVHFARELADWLENNGFSAWLDDKIIPGRTYDSTIEEAIRTSSVVVVVITNDIERPDSFVRKEIQYAADCHKPIVPVRLSNVQCPLLLMTRQWLSPEDALGPRMLEYLQSASETMVSPERRLQRGNRRRFSVQAILFAAVIASAAAVTFLWLPSLIAPSSNFLALGVNPAKQPPKDVLELLEILEMRAPSISQEIPDRDARTLFESLHSKNIEALREEQYILSHEITGQIHSLLDQHLPRVNYRPFVDSDLNVPSSFSDKVKMLAVSERYPLLESDVEATMAISAGSGPVSANNPPSLIPQERPTDSDPTGTPRLDPAGLPPSLSVRNVQADRQLLGGLNNSTRGTNANDGSQHTGDGQFQLVETQTKAVSTKELMGILGRRAADIEKFISGNLATDPRVEEIRNRFLSLHRLNMAALQDGNLALHRDLSAQVHELLRSVYHVAYKPNISDGATATLSDPVASVYPTVDNVNRELSSGQTQDDQ